MRLFLAAYPSKEFMGYFRDVKRGLDKQKRNLRYVSPERMHITLRYIGSEVTQASKNVVAREIQRHAGSYPKPEVEMDGVSLGFAYQKDPRVVLANITPTFELEELVANLHQYIRSVKRRDTIGWKQRNEAAFHISLARLKPSATRSAGREVEQLIEDMNLETPPPFKITEMHLVSSTITPRGPVYSKLETIKL